jgi:hypothetical protein
MAHWSCSSTSTMLATALPIPGGEVQPRATLMPARIIRSSISDESEAGPMVATILVRFDSIGSMGL